MSFGIMYLCDVMSISRTNCVDNSFNGIVGVDVGLTVGSAVCVAVSVGSTVVSGETVGSSVTCGVSVGVNISHGCVRLHPSDINWIANTIPFYTRIYITE